MKVNEAGDAVRVWPATTVSVTGISRGLPLAPPVAVILTVPPYWPGGRDAPFTLTVTVPGVLPPVGDAESQAVLLAVLVLTVNVNVPGVAETVRF